MNLENCKYISTKNQNANSVRFGKTLRGAQGAALRTRKGPAP